MKKLVWKISINLGMMMVEVLSLMEAISMVKNQSQILYINLVNMVIYETDDQGRIIRDYADDLQYKLHDKRLKNNRHTPDKLADDHAGHIFTDVFGGSTELDNLVSQAKDVNLKEYRCLKREWEDSLTFVPPKKVQVEIKINYDTFSKRPTSFDVTYSIDGENITKLIKNVNY